MPCWRFQALYKIREPFTILRRLVNRRRPLHCSVVNSTIVHGTSIAESNDVSTEFVFSQKGKRLAYYIISSICSKWIRDGNTVMCSKYYGMCERRWRCCVVPVSRTSLQLNCMLQDVDVLYAELIFPTPYVSISRRNTKDACSLFTRIYPMVL